MLAATVFYIERHGGVIKVEEKLFTGFHTYKRKKRRKILQLYFRKYTYLILCSYTFFCLLNEFKMLTSWHKFNFENLLPTVSVYEFAALCRFDRMNVAVEAHSV